MTGSVRSGVELLPSRRPTLSDARAGLVVHPASVCSDLTFSTDYLVEAGFRIEALFGPQHGARGEKQDNMIESDSYVDPVSGLPVHSLYGEVRKPSPEMLEGLDVVLFDLHMPDVNGVELAGALRAEEHAPRLVVLTGRASARDWALLHSLGVTALLAKPLEPDVLEAELQRALYE